MRNIDKYAVRHKVVDRAIKECDIYNGDRFSYLADLDTANETMALDFERLLEFDSFNFKHDIIGISNNVDRMELKLVNNFIPRCVAV